MATFIFMLSQVISLAATHELHVISFTLSVIIFLLFIFKIMIDSALKKRALENIRANNSVEQKNDHKKVEFLSIIILS